MTTREKNAIETAHIISADIRFHHGDVSLPLICVIAMQYVQWQWVVEDLGLARARKELIGVWS